MKGRRGTNRNAFVGIRFTDLPADILVTVLTYLDMKSLCRLSQTNKYLQHFCKQEFIWKKSYRRHAIFQDGQRTTACKASTCSLISLFERLPSKEKCRIVHNWEKSSLNLKTVMRYHVRQLPCMGEDDQYIWISCRNNICCFRQQPNSMLREIRRRRLQDGHQDDISKFVARDDLVASGGRDGSLCCWNGITGNRIFQRAYYTAHQDDVSCVDIRDGLIVSGSRDKYIKVWSLNNSGNPRHTIAACDRMWSVAISTDNSCLAGGTGGHNPTPPLRLWDLTTGKVSKILTSGETRNGAGVLDLHYESAHNLWSCGYDGSTRLWDTRTGQCVINWEDPYDMTVYCLKLCGPYGVVCGTSMYGIVTLWDRRKPKHVQIYYTMDKGSTSTPVYSIIANPQHLYVALDKHIKLVDFNVNKSIDCASNLILD